MNSNSINTKLESPSAERNKEPIWNVLESKVLPLLLQQDSGEGPIRILETAAGAGGTRQTANSNPK